MSEKRGVPLSRLKDLSDATVSQDGSIITVRLNATSGESADIEIELDGIGALIAYLCEVARAAGKNRDDFGVPKTQARNQLFGVPAEGMGFSVEENDLAALFPGLVKPGPENRLAALMVRLSGFDLAFQTGDIRAGDLPAWLRASANRIEESLR